MRWTDNRDLVFVDVAKQDEIVDYEKVIEELKKRPKRKIGRFDGIKMHLY